MKDIVKKAGGDAKLRLRGKGSGFVEHSTNKESEEALQLCISCTTAYGYDLAIQLSDGLLRKVYYDYDRWCHDKGLPNRAPDMRLRVRNAPDRGSYGHAPDPGGYGYPVMDAVASAGTRGKRKRGQEPKFSMAAEDKGEPPPGAPPVEEIERLIEERNQARKDSDYKRADEIRDDLHARKVVLSDERGASGKASSVTNWRYWQETKESIPV